MRFRYLHIFMAAIKRGISTAALICLCVLATTLHAVDALDLTPFACCDGQFVTTNVNGQPAWQTLASTYMYFNVPGTFTFSSGTPAYVRVVYLDEGYGTIAIHYDSVSGNAYTTSELHAHSSRVNTGFLATNYHQLASPAFLGRENGGGDFRLALQSGSGVPLTVRSVTIQNFPFSDTQFQAVLAKPWLQPYSGPARDDVDRSTLKGRMMAGYQGWFRAPNDYDDRGWGHWVRGGTMDPANFTIDMWPDLTDYGPAERFPAGNVRTRSGRPAYLFSSTTPETVRRHFQWMRKYNMDGAFLQRFVTRNNSGAYGNTEWVLNAVRAAAHQEGRIWGIEYDVSSLSDTNALEVMTNDWRWLCDVVRIREDSRYAYEGGKPVVFIWGLPFSDRAISQPTGNAIVDFFKNDPVYGGNYVIGGVPNNWRSMTTWFPHFQRYNGILAWMPPNAAAYLADNNQLRTWGIDYFPHAWPGFSWAHLKQLADETQYTPRNGGQFFWQKISGALASGAERLFIGMFDEYDEGTAIMPFTDDPPPPGPPAGRFITNLGRPVDWWMLLAQEARETLLHNRTQSSMAPMEAELSLRHNIGAEASIDLGSTDIGNRLSHVSFEDGATLPATIGGRDCRYNSNGDHYFYFAIDDTFASPTVPWAHVTIEFEYLDNSADAPIYLQYDSAGSAYAVHPKTYFTTGSGLWRTAQYEITNGYFGNRQNGGADFRIYIPAGLTSYVDRVRVILPDALRFQPPSATLVSTGSIWKYFDSGTDLGTSWRGPSFNDSGWKAGRAQLGYGEGDEATTLSYGTNASLRNVTAYFRRSFVVEKPGQFVTLVLATLRDDGAVAYLNGTEVYRALMPAGAITYLTLATNAVSGNDEFGFFEHNVDPSLLVAGTNWLAVEIHQPDRTSTDMSFDLALAGLAMTNLSEGVDMISPLNGATLVAASSLPISAVASSGGASPIDRVEFLEGTNKLGESIWPPYTLAWPGPALGKHLLSARAVLAGGEVLFSPPVQVTVIPFTVTNLLVSRQSTWKYLDNGLNQGAAWRGIDFNDAAWKSGSARLGYGGDGEVTTLSYGPNSSSKYTTYYFRKSINVADVSLITNLVLRLVRDDGAVVYLNSNEVFRSNMSAGAIGYSTFAAAAVSGSEELSFVETSVPATYLRPGTNVVAVEIHQSDLTSSDVGFDLEILGTGTPPPPRLTVTRGGAGLQFTWSTNVPGYQLEGTGGLNSAQAWTAAGVPTTNGGANTVVLPLSSPAQFFRLRR